MKRKIKNRQMIRVVAMGMAVFTAVTTLNVPGIAFASVNMTESAKMTESVNMTEYAVVQEMAEEVFCELLQEGGLLQEDASQKELAHNPLSQNTMGILQTEEQFFEPERRYASATDTSLEEALTQTFDSFGTELNVLAFGLNSDEFREAYQNFLNNHPQYFYVNGGYSFYKNNEIVSRITISYDYDAETCKTMSQAYEAGVKRALAGVKKDWSEVETVLYFNDYLTSTCEYDLTYSKYSSYNIFVEKTAVCQGYALAMKELCNRVGIECALVTSTSLNHAWNLVKVDGKYYHIDSTWNDPTADLIGRSRHYYFLKSQQFFTSAEDKHSASDYVFSMSNVNNNSASDTSMDAYFWNNVDTPFFYYNGKWYCYSKNENGIVSYTCNGKEFTKQGLEVATTGRVPAASGGYYTGQTKYYLAGDNIYYTEAEVVKYYSLANGSEGILYELTAADKQSGYIYGLTITGDGEVVIALKKDANDSKSTKLKVATVEVEDNEDNGDSEDSEDNEDNEGIGSILECEISLDCELYYYDGTEHHPVVTLKDKNGQSVSEENYSLNYENCIEPGEAKVTITPCGELKGEAVVRVYSIIKQEHNLSGDASDIEIQEGQTRALAFSSTTGNVQYVSRDKSIVEVDANGLISALKEGNTIIEISVPEDNHWNEKKVELNIKVTKKVIEKLQLSDGTMSISQESYVYDGKEKQPVVEVMVNNVTLEKDKDYAVKYVNNIQAGTATVIVTGMGDYEGEIRKGFSITQGTNTLTLSSTSVSKTASLTKNQTFSLGAKGKYDTITYKSSDAKIKVSTTGTVTIPKNYAGCFTIKVTTKGTENYKAQSKTVTVKVKPGTTQLTSVKGGARRLVLKWSKNPSATGYEIQYATNKSFKSAKKLTLTSNSTVTKKITGLAGAKGYYVRIRAYKTTKVNGTTTKLYSTWSSTKKASTTK